MKIYHVVSEAQIDFIKEEEFRLTVVEIEAKETEQNFIWSGRRLKKTELNTFKSDHTDVSSVRYGGFTTADGLEKAKQEVVELVRQDIDTMVKKMMKMQALAKTEPLLQERVKEFH